ncbi:microtubule associated protein [Colletotrichum graminicola]|uniref:Microtubule associated protein n=1 Tax=Colletotrichum graminicola (strain M1.001 / M2 / FGSC 10212) TaxID=645133 RepID=E3QLQ5_COLGM|nr:microtubule associated protein [Colletotrichum graminicola M1.001]EFQ31793.1 microtubule associated protein [Colletotrichum graminicola M1.001]WDK13553.1 microtubule associated protein [Colletotrichum graminicola]
MVAPGIGGLDTPRTNIGDATYLSRQPDFDISQEASFQSPPAKENNVLHQLRNGRSGGINLRTPRGRGPFADRKNLPAGLGGAEFTPMLKSATRNSIRRRSGKENGAVPNTPALGRVDEDMTPIPNIDTSMYQSRSFVDRTPLPEADSTSTATTPLVVLPRRDGKGPLQDGNQLSLREQESVIDKIEKENFGLKLKIHFLEEALRKAGPGFSEAALKENTELKVDKVTMQRELHKYKKHLTSAEKDLESYRQQMMDLQEKAKRKYADQKQLAEIERLQQALEDREADLDDMQRQLNQGQQDQGQVEKLQDEIGDLEAELREKERLLGDQEDEIDDLKTKLEEMEDKMKDTQRRMIELEQNAQSNDALEEAKDTIDELETNVRRLEDQVNDMKDKLNQAIADKEQAKGDLEELQDELANKSMVTKGLSRQKEEKLLRLQTELEEADSKFAHIEKQLSDTIKENENLKTAAKESLREREAADLEHQSRLARIELQLSEVTREKEKLKSIAEDGRQEQEFSDRERQSLLAQVEDLKHELQSRLDEKNLLQSRHEALTSESASLQRDVARLQKSVDELEESLAQERDHALEIERDIRGQYRDEIDRLNDEISDLQAEIREKDNLYDNDSEKWETDRHTLESERKRAEEKATGLERTIEKLREAEGNLSTKESRLQEALESEAQRHKDEQASLTRQIEDLQQNLESRQATLTELRGELSQVQDELRQTQLDYQAQTEKVEALEDEVEVLQTTLDEESEHSREELEAAKRECDTLRQQLDELRHGAVSVSQESAKSNQTIDRLRAQLDEATSLVSKLNKEKDLLQDQLQTQISESTVRVNKVSREKQSLQDQLASLNLEMHSLRSSLAEARAERDEIESGMKRMHQNGEETLRIDRERLDLRTSKMKLDNEVRRLKDENAALMEQMQSVEKSLEDEIEKAAEEEDRLNQEIRQLQAKLREVSSTEGHESVATRRTIRELERRIKDYEDQLALTQQLPANAGEGNSEISIIRRDLSTARQKEREYLQREAAHKEVVKGLKKQITELERKAHDAEMSRLIMSPASSSPSARKSEVSELRHQLSSAQQSMHDLKTKTRDAERRASQLERDFQTQLDDLEDQKLALEQALEDAQRDAEEAAALHEKALRRLQHKLERAEQDRQLVAHGRHNIDNMSSSERRDLQEMLRRTQTEADALEHDVIQQQETIDALMAAEGSLRRKLDRARSERAAYRLTAEKLQKDIRDLKRLAAAEQKDPQAVRFADQRMRETDEALETVIRAAENADAKHTKELRGMTLQMEWMQARWKREVSMRADAAYAKKFLQLELSIANACNKAQLRELEQIRCELLGSRKALPPPSSAPAKKHGTTASGRPTLKTVATMARFIARMRISAREWAKHEATRQRLANCVDEMRKTRRRKQLKVVPADDVVA